MHQKLSAIEHRRRNFCLNTNINFLIRAGTSQVSEKVLAKIFNFITLYNVCSVHRGDIMSTSGGVQYIGGIP